jgi:hypothetical protein
LTGSNSLPKGLCSRRDDALDSHRDAAALERTAMKMHVYLDAERPCECRRRPTARHVTGFSFAFTIREGGLAAPRPAMTPQTAQSEITIRTAAKSPL